MPESTFYFMFLVVIVSSLLLLLLLDTSAAFGGTDDGGTISVGSHETHMTPVTPQTTAPTTASINSSDTSCSGTIEAKPTLPPSTIVTVAEIHPPPMSEPEEETGAVMDFSEEEELLKKWRQVVGPQYEVMVGKV